MIGGIVVVGGRGVGKSTRLDAYAAWLKEQDLLEGHMVGVPLSVDRDRLLGGVDLEQTLATGSPVRSTGLLERARGGWIILDNLHLAEPRNLALVKQALDQHGGTRILAAADADEESWPHLIDAIPMHVSLEAEASVDPSADLARFWSWQSRQDADRWSAADRGLADSVLAARRRVASVVLADEVVHELVAAARSASVEGSRVDVAACRVARAHGALRDAGEVGPEDVAFAIATVIKPRARPAVQVPPPSASETSGAAGETDQQGESGERAPDRVFDALPAGPPDVDGLIARARGAASGRRAQRRAFDRGRHLRSRSVSRGQRLAVGETLRRAAVRQASEPVDPTRSGAPASPHRDTPALKVRVFKDDLRFRELRSRAGTLFVVAVDASGSMAWHRMEEAKGLVGALLSEAYRRRDAVALIAFRRDRAECLLPPTSALARARRELEVLPTGGGTPLASALQDILAIARSEGLRRERPVCALLLTDGRANVPLNPSRSGRAAAAEELEHLAARYRADGPPTLVIDSTAPGSSRDDARRLAQRLGAGLQRLG